MSTRASKRAQGGGMHHHGVHDPTVEPRRDTQTPVPESDRGSTSTDSWNPPRELGNVNAALHVPDCPYNIDEIHFLLWYILTTTLSPDKIAELFNHFFEPAQPIDRWAMLDIFNVIEARWQNNGKTFGENFRLVRPKAHGTCPCDFPDFNIDCLEVKRTAKTRQNQKYLTMAASLWDQPAADLVTCPRGRRSDQPSSSPVTPNPDATAFPSGPLTTYLREARPHIYFLRLTTTIYFWFSILLLWLAPPGRGFPHHDYIRPYLESYPAITLAALHLISETSTSRLDGTPDIANLRAMPLGEFIGHASLRLLLTLIGHASLRLLLTIAAFKAALVMCGVLGVLPDFNTLY